MLSVPISITLISLARSAWAQNECYYAAGKRAGSAYVSCGQSGTISSCCQLGDVCLSDSACWNAQYDVTYLYGCSDSTYTDPSCPWKCGPDFEATKWVGIEYCSNFTNNEWACTHPPANAENIQPNPPQDCTEDSIVAFAGPSVLQPILSLPGDVGGATEYFSQVNPTSYSLDPNYTPTTTLSLSASVPETVQVVSEKTSSTSVTTTASESDSPETSTASTSSFTSTGTTSHSTATAARQTASSTPIPTSSVHHSGLSTGAKAGIGAGVAVGSLALIAVVALLFWFRRKQLHQPVPQTEDNFEPPPSDMKEARSRPLSELEGTSHTAQGYDQRSSGNWSNTTNWHTAAPTYTSNEPGRSPLVGHNALHEMG